MLVNKQSIRGMCKFFLIFYLCINFQKFKERYVLICLSINLRLKVSSKKLSIWKRIYREQ